MNFIDKKISSLSKEVRVSIAILVGLIIIGITRYGSNITGADVLFAEMIHTISDTLVIFILLIAFFVNTKLLKVLGKISGILLCLAGVMAIGKVYTTFVQIATTHLYHIGRSDLLLKVSISTIVLILIQIALVWNEHGILHGEDGHMHHVHHATKTELIADITQAFAGLLEYILIVSFPDAPILIRFADSVLTLSLGYWMIGRGKTILFSPSKHHTHHEH